MRKKETGEAFFENTAKILGAFLLVNFVILAHHHGLDIINHVRANAY